MRITIDTNNKTIELEGKIPILELWEWLNENIENQEEWSIEGKEIVYTYPAYPVIYTNYDPNKEYIITCSTSTANITSANETD